MLSELIIAFAKVVDLVFNLYMIILVGRVIISWVNPDPYNPIVRFLHSATDPVLYRIRRAVPLVFGGFDLTPIVLLIALQFFQQVITRGLVQLAHSL
jgi:YggT family protein